MHPIAERAVRKVFELAAKGFIYNFDGELVPIDTTKRSQTMKSEEKVSFADLFGIAEIQQEITKAKGVGIVGDDGDDDDMSDGERKQRGIAATRKFRTSMSSAIFPLEEQPDRQPVGADAGQDRLGRSFADGPRLEGGGDVEDMDPIPNAGAGPTWENDTRALAFNAEEFMPEGEGNDGRVGGEDRGAAPVRPLDSYELLREGQTPGSGPTRSGPNWVGSPQASGIAPAAQPAFPDDSTRTLKTAVHKRLGSGLFSNIVNAPMPNTNRFDR